MATGTLTQNLQRNEKVNNVLKIVQNSSKTVKHTHCRWHSYKYCKNASLVLFWAVKCTTVIFLRKIQR